MVGAAVLLLEAPHVARHGYGRAAVPGRSVTAGGGWWVVDDSQITTGEGLRWLVSGGSRAVQCATQRDHQPTSASIGLPQSDWLPVSSTSSSPCVEAMCACGRVREGGRGGVCWRCWRCWRRWTQCGLHHERTKLATQPSFIPFPPLLARRSQLRVLAA